MKGKLSIQYSFYGSSNDNVCCLNANTCVFVTGRYHTMGGGGWGMYYVNEVDGTCSYSVWGGTCGEPEVRNLQDPSL